MQDLNDLFYFVQVVDHKGFSSAARALGIPKSRLSRRIAVLEERLGVRLIHRSTHNVSVTELGQAYYTHCAAMLVEASAAQEVIERSVAEPRGIIRMSAPPGLLSFVLADYIASFMRTHPYVNIELDATGRRVDIVREGLDLAIRVRFPPIPDSDLVVRHLSHSPQRLVASPLLLSQHGLLLEPTHLQGIPSLDWVRPDAQHIWHLRSADGDSAAIIHHPRLVTDDLITVKKAALAGIGLAQLPHLIVHEEIQTGRLVHVLPHWTLPCGVVQAVFPSRRGILPAVRAWIDFLAENFAEQDWLSVSAPPIDNG